MSFQLPALIPARESAFTPPLAVKADPASPRVLQVILPAIARDCQHVKGAATAVSRRFHGGWIAVVPPFFIDPLSCMGKNVFKFTKPLDPLCGEVPICMADKRPWHPAVQRRAGLRGHHSRLQRRRGGRPDLYRSPPVPHPYYGDRSGFRPRERKSGRD